MTIYNVEPAWIAAVRESRRILGRELTNEEISNIWYNTKNYMGAMTSVYNRYSQGE